MKFSGVTPFLLPFLTSAGKSDASLIVLPKEVEYWVLYGDAGPQRAPKCPMEPYRVQNNLKAVFCGFFVLGLGMKGPTWLRVGSKCSSMD